MKICFVAVGASALSQVKRTLTQWQQGPRRDCLVASLFYVGSDSFDENEMPTILAALEGQDMVLLDLMGAPLGLCDHICERLRKEPCDVVILNASTQEVRTLGRLGSFSIGSMSARQGGAPPDMGRMLKMLAAAQKLGEALPVGPLRDLRNYLWLGQYWRFSSARNIENLLLLLGREYGGCKDWPKPQPPETVDELCILDPNTRQAYPDRAAWQRERLHEVGKPTLGLLYSGTTYPVDSYPIVGQLVERLRSSFNVIPIATNRIGGRDHERLEAVLKGNGQQVDLLLTLPPFRLGQGPMGGNAEAALQVLRRLDVPVLHPFFLNKRTVEEWQNDAQGVQVGEFLISIFLPEMDGCIEAYPIGAMSTAHDEYGALTLIPERV